MHDMSFASHTWAAIDAIGERLGVPYFTRRKWFQRGSVPHRWRILILSESGGQISPHDFDAVTKHVKPAASRDG
jgi:hypothetical protein